MDPHPVQIDSLLYLCVCVCVCDFPHVCVGGECLSGPFYFVSRETALASMFVCLRDKHRHKIREGHQ